MSNQQRFRYQDFTDPKTQLVTADNNQNAHDIYCPQLSCGCLLLRTSFGTLVERPKDKTASPPNDEKSDPNGTTNSKENINWNNTNGESTSQSNVEYWQLTDMMAFENIGFSKTIEETGLKYICCADCNVGPLGYHDTKAQEKEYLIAVNRVSYDVSSLISENIV
ncbi:Mss4-like protein [Gigaspora margarita]|uniref:Mss4-like protein n=1 Tax=Gigaspora margarita TaxID=4874 RepID=A0A8H3WXQ8_GIGMA|nr:Mss4-like protein [Gigaspora margarita]